MNESPQNASTRSDHKSPHFIESDSFIPLGFSSPINQRQQDDANIYPSQQRNVEFFPSNRKSNYFRNNNRNRYQPNNRQSFENRGHYHQHQQKTHHKRFYSDQQTPNKQNSSDLQSYLHPSMVEDPWKHLVADLVLRRASQKQSEEHQKPSEKAADAENSDDSAGKSTTECEESKEA